MDLGSVRQKALAKSLNFISFNHSDKTLAPYGLYKKKKTKNKNNVLELSFQMFLFDGYKRKDLFLTCKPDQLIFIICRQLIKNLLMNEDLNIKIGKKRLW